MPSPGGWDQIGEWNRNESDQFNSSLEYGSRVITLKRETAHIVEGL